MGSTPTKISHTLQIFYFLLFLLAFTSADIIFHRFLDLHSTLSGKKIFVTNFFFQQFLSILSLNPLTAKMFFVDAP